MSIVIKGSAAFGFDLDAKATPFDSDLHLNESVHEGEPASSSDGAPAQAGSIAQLADFLVNGYWGGSGHHWASTTIGYSLGNLNATEQGLALAALAEWQAVAGVNFVPVANGAQITFSHNGNMQAVTNTSTSGSLMTSAIVTISSNWLSTYGSTIGSYGYQTYLHEIGHALGLGHQGPYNGSAVYGTNAVFLNDTWQYSVMSYFNQQNYGGSSLAYVVSPQMADIYAVQSLYGAGAGHSGNSTYNVGTTGLTIFDSGGNDTINAAGYSNNQTIDLTPGSFSSVAGLVNNIGIYLTSIIENASGGSGNDTIIGNTANNLLQGNGGNDVIYGGDGNDQLQGGGGTDTLNGGSGADTFIFLSPSDGGDYVQDFASGTDLLALSRSGFGLATTGSLAANGVNFVIGTSATTASPTIFYDPGSGNVYWDANGTGAGGVSLLATIPQGAGDNYLGALPGWSFAATGDFNGNGTDDILWQNASGANYLWLMGNNAPVSSGPLGAIPGWKILASGDLNGDGTSDLVWNNASKGENYVWLMSNGQPYMSYYGGLIPGWNLVATEDLNGDHTDDLLWQNPSTGENYLWTMSGGQPGNSYSLGVIPGWKLLAAGDINGDGTGDLIWNNSAAQINYIWLMNNGQPYASFYGGNLPGWNVAAVGDLNDDGTDDILWQNVSSGQAYLWLMSNGQPFNSFGISQLNGQKILGAGDYDHDGNSDILWQEAGTGAEHVLDMEAFLTPSLHNYDWTVV